MVKNKNKIAREGKTNKWKYQDNGKSEKNIKKWMKIELSKHDYFICSYELECFYFIKFIMLWYTSALAPHCLMLTELTTLSLTPGPRSGWVEMLSPSTPPVPNETTKTFLCHHPCSNRCECFLNEGKLFSQENGNLFLNWKCWWAVAMINFPSFICHSTPRTGHKTGYQHSEGNSMTSNSKWQQLYVFVMAMAMTEHPLAPMAHANGKQT